MRIKSSIQILKEDEDGEHVYLVSYFIYLGSFGNYEQPPDPVEIDITSIKCEGKEVDVSESIEEYILSCIYQKEEEIDYEVRYGKNR